MSEDPKIITSGPLSRRILEAYDLDISEIKTGNLLEIFRRIHIKR